MPPFPSSPTSEVDLATLALTMWPKAFVPEYRRCVDFPSLIPGRRQRQGGQLPFPASPVAGAIAGGASNCGAGGNTVTTTVAARTALLGRADYVWVQPVAPIAPSFVV